MISNPILPGFNPDPSILRVGDAYFIATSTFEWFPGVQIFKSTDLKSWSLVARPLNHARLLDMRGVPDSCGVWAPCLSYADGQFWLCYTIVTRFDGDFKDTPNFLTCCETVDGEWSDPVYLNASGFDPSLFHDDDGRKWLTNMVWDHRPDRTYFQGIMLQEYSVADRKLIGPRKLVYPGSDLGLTEGPHIYKRHGRYYLMVAEGGTGYAHAVTLARADDIRGPYVTDPSGHVITAKDHPDYDLQRCGHGSLVETPDGRAYIAHLASRPISRDQRRSPMGRETALHEVQWSEDGWLRLVDKPEVYRAGPAVLADDLYEFHGEDLPQDFQWLRTPEPAGIFSLTAREDALRLIGRDSIGSTFEQSLVARRQTHFNYSAETVLEFDPEDYQQMAGLVAYYNAHKFHYLYVSRNDGGNRHLGLMSCLGRLDLHTSCPLAFDEHALPGTGRIELGVDVRAAELQFRYRLAQSEWTRIGPILDASLLSDEAGKGEGANFTGAFIGMACQDLTGQRKHADFLTFHYRETG